MTNTELLNALKIMIGSQEAEAMYIGSSLLWSNTPTVPYDCKIEYLEGTGSQWIDTLIHPETGYGFELYGGFTTFNNNEFFGGGTIWSNGLGICTHQGGTYGIIVGTTEVCTITAANNVMHQFKVNTDGTVYVDNIYQGVSSTALPEGTYTMNIFRHSRTQVPQAAKIYYCKIFNSQGLVFDGIPVRKNGVGYMYDRVSGLLFGNSGTGSFILGPDIVEIEYLLSIGSGSGTQSIILDYIPQGNDIEIGGLFYLLGYSDSTAWTGLYGTYVNELTNVYRLIRFGNDANGRLYIHNNTRANGGGTDLNISLNTKYSFVSTFDTFEIDNTSYNNNKTSLGDANTALMILFGDKVMCRFYDFYIKKNNELVCDLIPVRIGQIGYMYDKISNKLYGSSSGDFILGPDKT